MDSLSFVILDICWMTSNGFHLIEYMIADVSDILF